MGEEAQSGWRNVEKRASKSRRQPFGFLVMSTVNASSVHISTRNTQSVSLSSGLRKVYEYDIGCLRTVRTEHIDLTRYLRDIKYGILCSD